MGTRRRAPSLVFDEVPFLYDRYRAGYPPDAIDDMVSLGELHAGDRVLEVGAGTGKLTLPLLDRGLAVTALEPGRRMAGLLRARLADRAAVLLPQRFEDAQLPAASFDLVASATAFHWIDPERRYDLAARALRPRGCLALIRNDQTLSEANAAYYERAAPVYERLGTDAEAPYLPPTDAEVPGLADEMTGSGAFELVAERRFVWEQALSTLAMLGYLRTTSSHRTLPTARRRELLGTLRALLDELGGGVTLRWVTTLSVGRAKPRQAVGR